MSAKYAVKINVILSLSVLFIGSVIWINGIVSIKETLNFTMSPQQKYETGMLPLCYNLNKSLTAIISDNCAQMYGGPVVPN
jgi:hypothetical protein